MIGKYRKKPVVIEAVRLSKENAQAVGVWCEADTMGWNSNRQPIIEIVTLEGVMYASVGDWIIKGVAGEFYPCKHEIFEATYESEG